MQYHKPEVKVRIYDEEDIIVCSLIDGETGEGDGDDFDENLL